MSSASNGRPTASSGGKKRSDIMNKKIPENPKYKHVQSTIDTGASLTKYMKKIEDIRARCQMTTYWVRRRKEEAQRLLNIVLSEHPSRYDPHYKYRRDEIFKRMKPTTFAQLILQVASISNMEEEAEEDARDVDVQSQQTQSTDLELANIRGDADTSRVSPVPSLALTEGDYGQDDIQTARSTLESAASYNNQGSYMYGVIRGMGEVDMTAMDRATHNPPPKPQVAKIDQPYKNSPCLVLDIRDEDSFKQCHIIGAYNYPSAMLSRSMNSFSKELLEYKNAVGKIIIIYDEDERLAPHAATTLVERGVDNLFMLSGGMKVLSQKFPEGFVTGSLPPSCQPAQPEGKTPRTKNTPRAVPTNNTPATRKMRFTPDDIQKIQNQLDESLIPSDTGSRLSRMSTNTSRNSKASMTSRTNNITVGGKPWKPT